MSESEIAAIVFGCVFGGAMVGCVIGALLPEHHLTQESKDVIKLATALLATMVALILSLLVSSAKTNFDRVESELVQNAARAISLDRTLADYGPETNEIRVLMKRTYAARIKLLFPDPESPPGEEDSPEAIVKAENLVAALWALSPQSEAQRGLRSQAVGIAADISSTRWLLLLQKDESIPLVLLVVVTSWLTIIFATWGLFAPRNATVIAALFVSALSVTGAVLLILEMNSPFVGLMKVSSATMLDALANLGR